jgi:hypothetical protein
MTKALVSALALAAIVAGCNGGGAHEAGPVPTATGPNKSGSTAQTSTATEGTSTSTSTSAIPLCATEDAAVAVGSRGAAAGTIRTVWRVRNQASDPCRSFGYPGMDFHTASGWLDVQVHRGGYPDIDEPSATVVVQPGASMYFVSYWADADTEEGPCQLFDRVKVTLPDNYVPLKLRSSGCVDRTLVYVGPVSTTPPS